MSFDIFSTLNVTKTIIIEAVAQMCSVKKVYLEISQNSRENSCAIVSFLINFAWKSLTSCQYPKYPKYPRF